jgi:hypothetical protein
MYQAGDQFLVIKRGLPHATWGKYYTIAFTFLKFENKTWINYVAYAGDDNNIHEIDVSTLTIHSAKRVNPWEKVKEYVPTAQWGYCECGAEAAKQPGHSQWCPKYRR